MSTNSRKRSHDEYVDESDEEQPSKKKAKTVSTTDDEGDDIAGADEEMEENSVDSSSDDSSSTTDDSSTDDKLIVKGQIQKKPTDKVQRRKPHTTPILTPKITESMNFINDLLDSGLGLVIWKRIKLARVESTHCLFSLSGTHDEKGYTKNIRMGAKLFRMDDPKDKRKRKKKISTCPSTAKGKAAWDRLKDKYDKAKTLHKKKNSESNFTGVEVLLHRLVCGLKHGKCTYPMYEASHLCNHPWCVNPKHLTWATPPDNHARKNCRVSCQHKPSCVVCKIKNCSYCC